MQLPRKPGKRLSAGAAIPKTRTDRVHHDKAYKYLLSNRNIFHQLLVSFVDEDFVKGLRPEDLELVPASFTAPGLKDRHADLIYRVSRPGREDDWNLPSNLGCLIAKNLPDRYIPSFEYFPLIEKDVPKATLDRLNNLVAAVILLERQKDEAGLAKAIAKVIDFNFWKDGAWGREPLAF